MAVIDAAGQLVIKRRITDDADGFAELLGMLESVGDISNNPIPVAIETRFLGQLWHCLQTGQTYNQSKACNSVTTTKEPTPLPGLRPAVVALRAAQNSGLPCSSDRRAPDPLRQSADGFALWSRLETRYLRLPSSLRRNIFR